MCERYWTLCVSKMANAKTACVKVLCSEDVPIKGERIWLLAFFARQDWAEGIRSAVGDRQILRNWRDRIQVDYTGAVVGGPHEELRDRFDD